MQQTCKKADVFLQLLFHSSIYLISRLLLKNRTMIILMANSNHTCLLVLRRTPVSGIDCVFLFVIFNSITSPRAASIRCFMTAVFPFGVACTGFEYLSFSSFLEIETAYFDVSTVSVIMISEDLSTFCNVTLSPCFKDPPLAELLHPASDYLQKEAQVSYAHEMQVAEVFHLKAFHPYLPGYNNLS